MKSGYKIDWSDEAQQNLDSIIDYLQYKWTERELRSFFKRLDKRIEIISGNPHAYPKIHKGSNVHRSVLSEQTSIYYDISMDTVIILSLFDNRKDPDSIKL